MFLIRFLAHPRMWNIALRSAHLAAMGILLGGHAFDVPREQLIASLLATLGTGALLGLLETGVSLVWFHQGRGLMTIAKLILIGLVPFFWDQRLAILLTVVMFGSIGSHMPARFRYFSILHRQIIRSQDGPGTAELSEDNTTEQEDT